MKRFLCLLFFLPSIIFAQDKVVLDSLLVRFKYATKDSMKVQTLLELANFYSNTDLLKSLDYSQDALTLSKRMNDNLLIALSHNNRGIQFLLSGSYKEALSHFLESISVYEELEDYLRLFGAYQNMGALYDRLEDFDRALDYYFKALAIFSREKEISERPSNRIQSLYNNIGNIYYTKKQFQTALDYYLKGFDLAREKNDDYNLGIICNNMGKLYRDLRDYDQALSYLQKSLEHRERMSDKRGVGMVVSQILCKFYFKQICLHLSGKAI